MSALRLGIPSKGRLQADCFDWFATRGLTLTRTGNDREYSGRVDGVDGVELVLLSATEIPRELAAGRIHLGVTGTDLVHEKLVHWRDVVDKVQDMGFGHANLVLAVPAAWVDVADVNDLDAVAARFRGTHGHRLRIATKYHRIVRQYLSDKGVADYQLIDSQGATEGTIKNEAAEAIADITSTGSTLTANGLRPLSDGPILRSQATVFASRRAAFSDDANAAMRQLCGLCDWEGLDGFG